MARRAPNLKSEPSALPHLVSDWERGGGCDAILARVGCAVSVVIGIMLAASVASAAAGIVGILRDQR